ncbi:hypothetical protein LBMAG27_09670 [Bacteroidota bacterium]|nr:hypothetical protein LBMAG27_09670 [Bacteroidota bacterium]
MKPDKNDLKKKLAAYCTLSAGFLAMHAEKACAQIIYTDVNPDAVLNSSFWLGANYQLDLNNDGIVDFRLSENFSSWSTYYMSTAFSAYLNSSNRIDGYGNNKMMASSLGNFPKPLSIGDTINANNIVLSNGILEHRFSSQEYHQGFPTVNNSFYSEQGLFDLYAEKYVGLKLLMGGNTYYGWARIKILWGEMIVYDYAVNPTPNQQILAGQQ